MALLLFPILLDGRGRRLRLFLFFLIVFFLNIVIHFGIVEI